MFLIMTKALSIRRGQSLVQRQRAGKSSKHESVTITAARIGGRYVLAATLIGALITVAFTTNGFGLLDRHSRQPTKVHGLPVRIDSVTLDAANRPTLSFAFAKPLVVSSAQLAVLNSLSPNDPQYNSWFISHGGVVPLEDYVKLVVEGNRPYPVRIIYMHVNAKCTQPLRGTYFLNSPAGGPGGNLDFQFNLDRPVPTPQLQYVRGDYFKTHTVVLRKGELTTFEIGSWTERHYCSYTLQMSVVDGDKTLLENVSYHGHPFQVTALAPRYRVLYIGGRLPGQTAPFVRQNPARFGS